MSGAVQLAADKRLRAARAEVDAQRIAAAVLQAKGEPGKPGPKGDKPDHEWQGTQLRFEKPDGSWGALVDLRGPKGAKGSRGASVALGGQQAVPPALPGIPSTAAPKSPTFAYTGDLLTGITYADGSTKTLAYVGGRLVQVDFSPAGAAATRKTLHYDGTGRLAQVLETTVP